MVMPWEQQEETTTTPSKQRSSSLAYTKANQSTVFSNELLPVKQSLCQSQNERNKSQVFSNVGTDEILPNKSNKMHATSHVFDDKMTPSKPAMHKSNKMHVTTSLTTSLDIIDNSLPCHQSKRAVEVPIPQTKDEVGGILSEESLMQNEVSGTSKLLAHMKESDESSEVKAYNERKKFIKTPGKVGQEAELKAYSAGFEKANTNMFYNENVMNLTNTNVEQSGAKDFKITPSKNSSAMKGALSWE